MEEESVVKAIVSDIESQNPISKQTLNHFQTLLDDTTDLAFMYAELSSRNLSPNALVSALSDAMYSGEVSLLGSSVYLSLILAPNSPVFTLFTPLAFSSLLRAIRRGFKNKIGTSDEGSSQNRKKGSGKTVAQKGKSDDGGLDVGLLFRVLEKVELVLGLVHLDRFEDSKKGLVQTVAEIPVMGCEVLGNTGGNYKKLCDLCSRILAEVLKAEHGDQSISAAEVLKSLTPLILASKLNVRSFGLEFIVNGMVRMGESSSEVKKAVVNLAKYLVHKASERAEPRALAVECIVKLVKVFEFEDQVGFVDYVVKMSQGVGKFRILAVDLILALMMSLRDPLGLESGNQGEEEFWGFGCLEALNQRCSDVTGTIRAKALSSLAQLVEFLSKNDRTRASLKGLMGIGNAKPNRAGGGMENLLKRRCLDEKAAVRKAALFLISKLIGLSGSALDGDLLKTVGLACSDPLLSIRKAAQLALSEAFRLFPDANVTREWLHSVPRLISDHETGIQDECENLFSELILDRVCEAVSDAPPKDSVLCILRESCVSVVTPWVRKICSSLGKKKRLKPRIITALQNIISQFESLWVSKSMPIEKWVAPPGAWFLLAEVSAFLPKAVDWEFLVHHWQLFDKHKPGAECQSPVELRDAGEEVGIESHSVTWAGDRVFLLQAISNVAMKLPPEPAAGLAHDILTRIQDFDMHSTEVNAHVKALRTLCTQKASDPNEVDKLVKKWGNKLLHDAVRIVEMYLSGDPKDNQNTFLTPDNSSKKRAASSRTNMLSRAITAVYTIGSLVIVYPAANLKSIVPVLHTIITSGNSDPKSKILLGSAILLKHRAPSLYNQAWVTMGKICLADGDLAKRYIPLFMQELEKSDMASLRNNIVVAMADFCVRHTALVDCYMPKITKCLRDPCEVVRRQTFILLARLLQRDYVKWRGLLFLRFLLSLVDESEEIRRLADFLFGNILKVKAPLLAYNSFVEAIFTLNDCNAHTGRANPQNSKNGNAQFCIRGNDEHSRSRRLHIYVTLLKQMAPEHLLTTFAKVCAEILAAAPDGLLNIDDPTGQSVLQDAFQILCSKEIRFSTTRHSSTDAAEMEEDGGGGDGAAKGKVITQALKKSLIQNAVPIFIELKRLLESKNSALIGSLMECLRVLLKDYKNEIDDILVADKQLQKELIYDMQKYESMKAKSVAAEAVATMQEAYKSPGDPKNAGSRDPRNARSPRDPRFKSPVDPRVARSGLSNWVENACSDPKVASAMADAVAATRALSVLKEVINNGTSTPPLSAMSVPKLKSRTGGAVAARGEKSSDVIESVRRRYSFDDDDES